MPQTTVKIWKNIACLVAVYGNDIAIRKPLLNGMSSYNNKKYFSIVLMASVDVNYRFTPANVGSMGSLSDRKIWLWKKLNSVSLLPEPKPPPEQNTETP